MASYPDRDSPHHNSPIEGPHLELNYQPVPTVEEQHILEQPDRDLSNSSFRSVTHHGQKVLTNEAHLIRNLRITADQKTRKSLELMCEEKASKYKLEEAHYSLPSSNKSTFHMAFSPDGQRVASTHGDHLVYICDLNTGKLLDTLEGHPRAPSCLAWHPSSKDILASGCLGGEVRVWDLKSKACELWTSDKTDALPTVLSLDFHPKERVLVIAIANDIHFWDWSESEPFAKSTTTHDGEMVKFVEFDSSGTKLITGILNRPKCPGYSSESLQNRSLDGLTQNNLDTLPTENMTQNSEITSPINRPPSSDERMVRVNCPRQSHPGLNNNENDINYGNTIISARVAFIYRQLEASEDSMRHTSFSPYIGARSYNPTVVTSPEVSNQIHINTQMNTEHSSAGASLIAVSHNQEFNINNDSSSNQLGTSTRVIPPISSESSPRRETLQNTFTPSQSIDLPPDRFAPTSTASEQLTLSFDASLEHIQLAPLVLDGRVIDTTSYIDHHPIDLPRQIHYILQCESINQVNPSFFRISKLMSSVRVYRQVVQQILSSSTGRSHFQPNQVLTAQSALPRSSRNASNLPVVFHNISLPLNLGRNSRSTDPILAIQFRNLARNVPLVTVCNINLLSIRSFCIMQSQQLIEQTITSLRTASLLTPPVPTSNKETISTSENGTSASQLHEQQATERSSNQINLEHSSHSVEANQSFHIPLNRLHQSLKNINDAPLTTSNVHVHISTLRNLINQLLETLVSMFHVQEDGQRLIALIHDVAHSLTGRRWILPLGSTLDDIRLDVIHVLCVVDFTLHLARQVQFLQLQRLSAGVRIETSRRTASSLNSEAGGQHSSNLTTPRENQYNSANTIINPEVSSPSCPQVRGLDSVMQPGTSYDGSSESSSTNKRKSTELGPMINVDMCDNLKRQKLNTIREKTEKSTSGNITPQGSNESRVNTLQTLVEHNNQSSNSQSVFSDMPPLIQDRYIIWNSAPSQMIEQNVPRFPSESMPNVSSSHFLFRIRLLGSSALMANVISDHPCPNRPVDPPTESRRRALSHDNTSASTGRDASNQVENNPRARQLHAQLNMSGSPEALPRHPHANFYPTRAPGQHLWFNHWTYSIPACNINYRLQCWNFSLSAIPDIKDCESNMVTNKCRIRNDASIDISSDGSLIACLVPRYDGSILPNFDLKIFSLRSFDFGACYYQVAHGSNAISVSLSPSAGYAVVGLENNKIISSDHNDDDLTIAKVIKLDGKNSFGHIRDIKIKRDDSPITLNAIRWMPRGIVYNVGPQPPPQRYQATRMRNRVAQVWP